MDGSGDTLEAAQRFIFITQVYFCAMYAIVLWDWIICLAREWQFIWKTHWTPVKIAYLFCRYWVIAVVPYLLYCFVVNHSLETCQRIYKIPVALAMWNQVASESILLIRTYAFFNRNLYILSFLIMCLAGLIAYQLYVDTSQMALLPFVTPPFVTSCFSRYGPCSYRLGIRPVPTNVKATLSSPPRPVVTSMNLHTPNHFAGFFIAPLLFDTIVTFMTIWKAFRIRRQSGGSPNSRLIQTFLREGVFYYILISVANLINGIFYLQPRQVISAINIPLTVMLAPVLAARLILDLRERGAQTVSHSQGSGIAPFTTKAGGPDGSPVHTVHRRHNYRRQTNIVLQDADTDMELGDMHTPGSDTKHIDLDSDTRDLDDDFIEMGFKAAKRTSLDIGDIRGIRVDVEQTTTTM